MKLIVITPEQTPANELNTANRLFENGLQRLHIRKPSFTTDQLREYLGAIAPQYHQYLVLHNHFNLFHEFKTGGIHLSSYARNDISILKLIENIPPQLRSTSFHSWQEILDNTIHYGYVFISPVFDSVSKPGYAAGIDLNGATQIRSQLLATQQYCPEIIGLGGVTKNNLGLLHQYKFDGGAMLGNVWMAADPVTDFMTAMETTRLLTNA